MLNRTNVELLGRAAADVAKSATEVLGLHGKLRYAEEQVALDVWHPKAATAAQQDLDGAEALLRGLVEVLRLQLGELEP